AGLLQDKPGQSDKIELVAQQRNRAADQPATIIRVAQRMLDGCDGHTCSGNGCSSHKNLLDAFTGGTKPRKSMCRYEFASRNVNVYLHLHSCQALSLRS